MLTMVERKTLYIVIMRLTGKQSGLLAEAAVAGLKALKSNILIPWGSIPRSLLRTLVNERIYT
ncbi:MAG: hypothetical protein KZQ71_09490 [Candidatus Thiodiazotropha sp. (ex Lucinoma aequizonata)]|nr:hypothetical protein [Candidatus Thiodiazotropha sp. (ex Lucinoma aequizonata)]